MIPYCAVFNTKVPEIEISICRATPEIGDRLRRFERSLASKPAAVRKGAMIFVEASYLRHSNHVQYDALKSDPIENWRECRAKHLEAYILMEAWRPGMSTAPDGLCGVLLLRSGWNGDVVVDYVVSAKDVNDRYGIRCAGRKLVAAALAFAEKESNQMVWVETAADSTDWWRYLHPENKLHDFLDCGDTFIRYTKVKSARARVEGYFSGAGARFKYAI